MREIKLYICFMAMLTQDVEWAESSQLYLSVGGMSVSVKYLQAIKVFSSVMGWRIQWVNLCNGLKYGIKRMVLQCDEA